MNSWISRFIQMPKQVAPDPDKGTVEALFDPDHLDLPKVIRKNPYSWVLP